MRIICFLVLLFGVHAQLAVAGTFKATSDVVFSFAEGAYPFDAVFPIIPETEVTRIGHADGQFNSDPVVSVTPEQPGGINTSSIASSGSISGRVTGYVELFYRVSNIFVTPIEVFSGGVQKWISPFSWDTSSTIDLTSRKFGDRGTDAGVNLHARFFDGQGEEIKLFPERGIGSIVEVEPISARPLQSGVVASCGQKLSTANTGTGSENLYFDSSDAQEVSVEFRLVGFAGRVDCPVPPPVPVPAGVISLFSGLALLPVLRLARRRKSV